MFAVSHIAINILFKRRTALKESGDITKINI